MRKIGFFLLVVVVVLGGLGIGYEAWIDTLFIEGTVETGVLKVGFTSIFSEWDVEDYNEWLRAQGLPAPEPKEVADAKCTLHDLSQEGVKPVYDRLHMEITNGYPCYWGINKFRLDNAGTIPAHYVELTMTPGPGLVVSNEVIGPDGKLIGWDLADLDGNLVLNVWLYREPENYGWGWEWQPPNEFPAEFPPGNPIPESLIGYQTHPCESLLTELWVHVKQPALQDHTYTFDIEIQAKQWNE